MRARVRRRGDSGPAARGSAPACRAASRGHPHFARMPAPLCEGARTLVARHSQLASEILRAARDASRLRSARSQARAGRAGAAATAPDADTQPGRRPTAPLVDAATLCLIDQVRAAHGLRPLRVNTRTASGGRQRRSTTWCAGTTSPTTARPGLTPLALDLIRRATRRTPRACSTGQNIGWGTGRMRPRRAWSPRGWPRPAPRNHPHRRLSATSASASLRPCPRCCGGHHGRDLRDRVRRARPERPPAIETARSARRDVRTVVGSSCAAARRHAPRVGPRGGQARPRERRGTRPPSAPASEAGPPAEAIPSTRIAFSPRLSFSRPSLELTSSPESSRTRSRR